MENAWGTLRFNLFYLTGVVLMDVWCMIFGGYASVTYLNLSLFLSYATLHPEVEWKINVTDDELSVNNERYHISGGVCQRMDEDSPYDETLTITQLTHRVLTEENPSMSLMMND